MLAGVIPTPRESIEMQEVFGHLGALQAKRKSLLNKMSPLICQMLDTSLINFSRSIPNWANACPKTRKLSILQNSNQPS